MLLLLNTFNLWSFFFKSGELLWIRWKRTLSHFLKRILLKPMFPKEINFWQNVLIQGEAGYFSVIETVTRVSEEEEVSSWSWKRMGSVLSDTLWKFYLWSSVSFFGIRAQDKQRKSKEKLKEVYTVLLFNFKKLPITCSFIFILKSIMKFSKK